MVNIFILYVSTLHLVIFRRMPMHLLGLKVVLNLNIFFPVTLNIREERRR